MALLFTCFSASNVFGDFTEDFRVSNNVLFEFGPYVNNHPSLMMTGFAPPAQPSSVSDSKSLTGPGTTWE